MQGQQVILQVKNLCWGVAGRTLIDIDNFVLHKGETIALIGPNGAGKSSLVKLLALLEKPWQGEIIFDGRQVTGSPLQVRRQMAMVFQEALLLSGSVFGNVAQGLRFRGLPRDQIARRVNYWLKKLQIAHLADRHIRYLSGGEAQRVSIARALALEPQVLFLDEPFAALDLPTRITLIEEIGEIIKATATATVFITHNVEEIPLLAGRVCAMSAGKIVQDCSTEDIFRYPVNEEVARLVGIENVLQGVVLPGGRTAQVGETVISFVARQDYRPGTNINLCIRPEDVILIEDRKPDGGPNLCRGRVTKIYPLSSQLKLTVDCGFSITLQVNKELFFAGRVRSGSLVNIMLPPEKIYGLPLTDRGI
ncbi:ABC transporter ATP-binding protein [Desulforamulus hydrothermalis]|uniref:Ferric transporter subunit ATP-binding component of ABC transporter CP4-6 prophage n=1 Tax=Desulforamulus hydrothermalis Lam5 = DSM 18033 TaxID=1121428 RepID=K8DYF7_9FIRM|nr:ABC transporter ATP-binding protein [Desulforamulus hydrothermalis]CCO07790.1 ferric transporter subunit; ATP-binding component of ABC transporter; CP4-6 prophage [Desulforamulus hydrothermalis Lam5 = DSM 18033]SHH42919.1 tungstate transport system ATP-binding protein [Desulforamulus hydrothermalis Lam5 = DSM 18033]